MNGGTNVTIIGFKPTKEERKAAIKVAMETGSATITKINGQVVIAGAS